MTMTTTMMTTSASTKNQRDQRRWRTCAREKKWEGNMNEEEREREKERKRTRKKREGQKMRRDEANENYYVQNSVRALIYKYIYERRSKSELSSELTRALSSWFTSSWSVLATISSRFFALISSPSLRHTLYLRSWLFFPLALPHAWAYSLYHTP